MKCQGCGYEFHKAEETSFFCPECFTVVDENLPDIPDSKKYLEELIIPLKNAEVLLDFGSFLFAIIFLLLFEYSSSIRPRLKSGISNSIISKGISASIIFPTFILMFFGMYDVKVFNGFLIRVFKRLPYSPYNWKIIFLKMIFMIVVVVGILKIYLPNVLTNYINKGYEIEKMRRIFFSGALLTLNTMIFMLEFDIYAIYCDYKKNKIEEKFQRFIEAVNFENKD